MNPMYITFAIYLVAVLLIGLAAYFSTRNFDDYILGGRSLGPFVTAMSAGASDMSGWLLMGLPGAIYLSGLNEAWIAIGLVIGAYFNWLLVAGRLRVHTEYANNALTLPDYFFHRFGAGGHLMKVVSAIIILFFFTIYCASGIVAGATLFQSLFEGMTYTQAMWLGAGATIAYTFLGGFLAVSWTDTLQASLMIFCADFDAGNGVFGSGRCGSDVCRDSERCCRNGQGVRQPVCGDNRYRHYFHCRMGLGLFRPTAYFGALYGG